jgi:hypothetical protein
VGVLWHEGKVDYFGLFDVEIWHWTSLVGDEERKYNGEWVSHPGWCLDPH